MAFQPTVDGASARMVWSYSTYEWSNVLWFARTGFTETDQEDLADAIMVGFATEGKSIIPSTVTLERVEVTDMRTEGAPLVISTEAARAGTNAQEPLPVNVAAVLTLRSALRGRSYRGRVYIGGLSENGHTAGLWDATLETPLVAWFQLIKNNATAIGWTWSIRTGQHNNIVLTNAELHPVISHELRNRVVGSQRRRTNRP